MTKNDKSQNSSDYNFDEEMKSHPGFGKPLPKHIFSGDIYSNFLNTAREAGYLPPFVALQKEIRKDITNLLELISKGLADDKVTNSIVEINEKIKKYNRECPTIMQKMLLSRDTLDVQAKVWE